MFDNLELVCFWLVMWFLFYKMEEVRKFLKNYLFNYVIFRGVN